MASKEEKIKQTKTPLHERSKTEGDIPNQPKTSASANLPNSQTSVAPEYQPPSIKNICEKAGNDATSAIKTKTIINEAE